VSNAAHFSTGIYVIIIDWFSNNKNILYQIPYIELEYFESPLQAIKKKEGEKPEILINIL
jgi:hypothetical protein